MTPEATCLDKRQPANHGPLRSIICGPETFSRAHAGNPPHTRTEADGQLSWRQPAMLLSQLMLMAAVCLPSPATDMSPSSPSQSCSMGPSVRLSAVDETSPAATHGWHKHSRHLDGHAQSVSAEESYEHNTPDHAISRAQYADNACTSYLGLQNLRHVSFCHSCFTASNSGLVNGQYAISVEVSDQQRVLHGR